MSTIRADTDQLRSVARQMRSTADLVLAGAGAAAREMDSLAATWSGGARDRGMARWAEIRPRYQPDAERLSHFAQELEALADRLDEAARAFGDSVGASETHREYGDASNEGRAGEAWLEQARAAGREVRPAETTMAGVFDVMQGHQAETRPDLQIYQVGENEFAVLMQGSDALQVGGMNPLLPNAFLAGSGFSTEFTAKIREKLLKLAGEHPGARINLVGYSQGGIEAQNLAGDSSFWRKSGLEMASISTYATPNPLKAIDPSRIAYDYDSKGDLVSNYATPIGGFMLLSQLTSPKTSASSVATIIKGVDVHTNDYYSHSTSEKRKEMEANTPPWMKADPGASKEWVLYDSADDGDMTIDRVAVQTYELGKAGVSYAISATTSAAVDVYNAATEARHIISEQAGKAAADTYETAFRLGSKVSEYTGKALKDAAIAGLPAPARDIADLVF